MRRFWPLLGLILILTTACKREKEIIVPDNVAPPDYTVTDLVLESYINRSYITLLGYQPDAAAMAQGKATLRVHNVSMDDRSTFLDQLMAQPAYAYRLFDIGRATLLNAVDTSDIRQEIMLLDYILSDSNYVSLWDLAQLQRDQLQDVLDIPTDIAAGTIDAQEMFRRLVTNKGYDEINMGTQNFVVSMFQNFLARYPTDGERTAAETMVDGFSSQVFLVNGNSKTDFIAIFLGSNDYYEGQVRALFARYLYRSPTTEETEALTVQYKNSGDYQALQKAVLIKDEFVGL